MKKFALLFILPAILFAQKNPSKSLLELKSQMNIQPVEQTKIFEDEYKTRKKSVGLALLYSALLPGMGELYGSDYSLGKYLTISDGVLWGVLIGYNAYSSNMEDNYKSFATSIGSAGVEGKDDKYFADMGNYLDIDQYNRRQELDRNFNEIYDDETHYWKWDGQAQRSEYRSMWKSSETADNNIRFVAGALILNRIVSMINAVRVVSKHNNRLKEELGWNVSLGVTNHVTLPKSLTLNFTTNIDF